MDKEERERRTKLINSFSNAVLRKTPQTPEHLLAVGVVTRAAEDYFIPQKYVSENEAYSFFRDWRLKLWCETYGMDTWYVKEMFDKLEAAI